VERRRSEELEEAHAPHGLLVRLGHRRMATRKKAALGRRQQTAHLRTGVWWGGWVSFFFHFSPTSFSFF
jgi:hypothetical protein